LRKKEQIEIIRRDCVFFHGDRPCLPHRREGKTCRCSMYRPRENKILLIELSSPARLIRSHALLARLKQEDPDMRLVYLTRFPELLQKQADEVLDLNPANMARLQMDSFEMLINPDMDRGACAIANLVDAKIKKGFSLRASEPWPLDEDAYEHYLRKLFPQSMTNEGVGGIRGLFQMCGLEYRRETPRLLVPDDIQTPKVSARLMVGLDVTPLEGSDKPYWPPLRWMEAARMLKQLRAAPILLGSREMDGFMQTIAASGAAICHGPMSPADSLRMVAGCDLVIGAEGLGVQLALAMGKQAVLIRRPDDRSEICPDEYHGRCGVLEPAGDSAQEKSIFDVLPDRMIQAIQKQCEPLLNQSPQKALRKAPLQIQPETFEELETARETVAQHRRRPE